MKSKINIKLLFFIVSLFFLILTLILIQFTYARYVTSLTDTSSIELGKWLIYVNNQDITTDSNLSTVIVPEFIDSEYIAEGKIVPTSEGFVEIEINYQAVTVPFKYDISFEHSDSSFLEDFKFTGYSIDDSEVIPLADSSSTITDTISPTDTPRTRTLKLNFTWFDGTGEALDDNEDTTYSNTIDQLLLNFNMEFTQLQSST